MATDQVQKKSPVATFFIGGAADKSKFWGIAPKTRLIYTELFSRYRDEIPTTSLGSIEINKTEAQAYYGYGEIQKIFLQIKALHQQTPSIKIRLVGHSLGGWRAARLCEMMSDAGMAVSLLITIDPVGVFYFARIEANERTPPRPMAKLWINISACHTIAYTQDDLVADLGIRWHPDQDAGLKNKPTYNYCAPNSHADIWKMMAFPGIAGKSAWNFLKSSE